MAFKIRQEGEVHWYWNAKAARYQWRNGSARFLPRTTVLDYVRRTIEATSSATDVLASLVSNGELAPGDWREAMRRYIKDEYIRQGVLAAGGRAQMTPRFWGIIGNGLKEQYSYLDGFADAIEAGELSEAQIAMRARMYVNSAREAFEKINKLVHIDAGFDEEIWVVDPKLENCVGCLELESYGWVKIADDAYGGCAPGTACTPCLTSCGCHKEYRRSPEAEAALAAAQEG